MKRRLMGVGTLCLVWCTVVCGGDILDPVMARLGTVAWGSSLNLVHGTTGPVFLENNEILVAADSLGGRNGTVNYLLNDSGQVYNVSYHLFIPISEIEASQAIHKELTTALRKRFGRPTKSEKQGNPRQAAQIMRDLPKRKEFQARFVELMKSGDKPDPEELKKLMKDGPTDILPSLFYSEEWAWETPDMWVFCSLLASNQGVTQHHLNFVSKALTQGEEYSAKGKRKLFSYTPLDRDQDRISKWNRTVQAQGGR